MSALPNLFDADLRQRMADLYGAKHCPLSEREKEDARILAECPVVFEENRGAKDDEEAAGA